MAFCSSLKSNPFIKWIISKISANNQFCKKEVTKQVPIPTHFTGSWAKTKKHDPLMKHILEILCASSCSHDMPAESLVSYLWENRRYRTCLYFSFKAWFDSYIVLYFPLKHILPPLQFYIFYSEFYFYHTLWWDILFCMIFSMQKYSILELWDYNFNEKAMPPCENFLKKSSCTVQEIWV